MDKVYFFAENQIYEGKKWQQKKKAEKIWNCSKIAKIAKITPFFLTDKISKPTTIKAWYISYSGIGCDLLTIMGLVLRREM
jgi:hypothetical protein